MFVFIVLWSETGLGPIMSIIVIDGNQLHNCCNRNHNRDHNRTLKIM